MAHPKFVYLNDRVVPWDEGRVHVASVGFKFGIGVFEGLRGYWNAEKEQMFVLQLAEHMHRLEYSQKFMRFDEILPGPDVGERILELLRANGFRENVYILPMFDLFAIYGINPKLRGFEEPRFDKHTFANLWWFDE